MKLDQELLNWLDIQPLSYIKDVFIVRIFSESIGSSLLVEGLRQFKIFPQNGQRERSTFFLRVKKVESPLILAI